MNVGHYGHTIQLTTPEEQTIFLKDIKAPNFLPRVFAKEHVYSSYDQSTYDFAGAVGRLLVAKGLVTEEALATIPDLGQLHRILPQESMDLDASELNKVSQQFYETDADFLKVYQRFIKSVVVPLLGTDVLFQATPTIRFHFPHQRGFDWKPRYHTDIMLGHPPQEVNVWIPLTRAFGTNSMTMAPLAPSVAILEELDYDLSRFALMVQTDTALQERLDAITTPVDLPYGEFLLFDSRCLHATQYNDSTGTRISIDVRVVPIDDYRSMGMIYRGTGRRRMAFDRGHYYDERTAESLEV